MFYKVKCVHFHLILGVLGSMAQPPPPPSLLDQSLALVILSRSGRLVRPAEYGNGSFRFKIRVGSGGHRRRQGNGGVPGGARQTTYGHNLTGRAARTVVSPGCRARPTLESFGCVQISFFNDEISPLNSACFRKSRIIRLQVNLANAHP